MPLYLKSAADIQALIDGPDYAAIDTATKTKLALHFEEMPASVLEAAFDVIVATLPADEANFARALFGNAPPATGGGGDIGGSGGGGGGGHTSGTFEYTGQVHVPSGVDYVDVVFSPALPAQPLAPWCSVQRTDPTAAIITFSDCVNLTPGGFRATLSAVTPAEGYRLSYNVTVQTVNPNGDSPMGGSLL